MIPEYQKFYLIKIDSTGEQVKVRYSTKREFEEIDGGVLLPEDVTVLEEISMENYHLKEE